MFFWLFLYYSWRLSQSKESITQAGLAAASSYQIALDCRDVADEVCFYSSVFIPQNNTAFPMSEEQSRLAARVERGWSKTLSHIHKHGRSGLDLTLLNPQVGNTGWGGTDWRLSSPRPLSTLVGTPGPSAPSGTELYYERRGLPF